MAPSSGPIYEAQMPKGTEPTPAKVLAFFTQRVRANLHLVLCFSPIGNKFRVRARQFPGLINECTVDWYMPWPEAALASCSHHASACECSPRRHPPHRYMPWPEAALVDVAKLYLRPLVRDRGR